MLLIQAAGAGAFGTEFLFPSWASTRYWDDAGVEVKELKADVESIRQVGDIWLPMKATMRDLRLDTFTSLEILDFVANPKLPKSTFEAGRLNEAH